MRLPPKAEALDATDDLPYPIETIRFWYVSPFGGRSRELEGNQVGLNRQALVRNTELEPEDIVRVGVVGTNPDRPWFFQETFEVVALDTEKPEAAELSPQGEVVLSEAAYDFVRRPYLQPRVGEAVVLKGTPKLIPESPEWLLELLAKSEPRPND